MALIFNMPPNWPQKPRGWRPEPGWRPDPAWGPAPDKWQFWVEDDAAAQTPETAAQEAKHAPSEAQHEAPTTAPAVATSATAPTAAESINPEPTHTEPAPTEPVAPAEPAKSTTSATSAHSAKTTAEEPAAAEPATETATPKSHPAETAAGSVAKEPTSRREYAAMRAENEPKKRGGLLLGAGAAALLLLAGGIFAGTQHHNETTNTAAVASNSSSPAASSSSAASATPTIATASATNDVQVAKGTPKDIKGEYNGYSGKGVEVFDMIIPGGAGAFYTYTFEGKKADSQFSIQGMDLTNEPNEYSHSYTGKKLQGSGVFDVVPGSPHTFKIKADGEGEWNIKLFPLSSAPLYTKGQTVSSDSPEAFYYEGDSSDLDVRFVPNDGAKNPSFSLQSGVDDNPLVAPSVKGKAALQKVSKVPGGKTLILVSATEGKWSVTFK